MVSIDDLYLKKPIRLGYKIGLLCIYLALSLFIFTMWAIDTQTNTNLNDYSKAPVDKMVYGTARKPYVLRTLIPSTVRIIKLSVPEENWTSLEARFLTKWPQTQDFMAERGWNTVFLSEFLIAFVLIYLSLFLFTIMFRQLFKELYDSHEFIADAVPIAALFILPVFFSLGTHFLYDLPTLFFSVLLLWFIARQKFDLLFFIAFFVATLNKETTLLFIVVFAIYGIRNMSRRSLIRYTILLFITYGIAKFGLQFLFQSNSGMAIEIHFLTNLQESLIPYDFAFVTSMILLLIAIFRDFRQKHPLLQIGLTMIIPLIVLMFIGGRYGEIRVFYEVFAVILLLGFHTVIDFMHWPIAWRKAPRYS